MKTAFLTTTFLVMMALLAACDEAPKGGGGQSETTVALAAPGGTFSATLMFVVDRSAESATIDPHKGRSRLQIAVDHACQNIAPLTDNVLFQVMSYGDPTTETLFATFRPATAHAKAVAISYLQSLTPLGPSPQHTALYTATRIAPPDLNIMYYYSASVPGADPLASGGVATYPEILAEFPAWWVSFIDAQLLAIRVGDTPASHNSFMMDLAALAGGSYINLQ